MDHSEAIAENRRVSKDGDNAQQQRRLARHSIAATTMSLVLLAAVCNLHWCTPDATESHVFIPTTIVTVCFTVTTVTMLAHAKGRNSNIDAFCVAAYGSTALLMLAPISVLLLLDKANAVITVPLFPVAICFYLVLRKGAHIGFATGAAQYDEQQDHELSCLFRLAAGVTVPSYAGLVGHIVSKFRGLSNPQERIGVNAVECLLLYSVVAGLLLMLLASSPPALYLRKTRAIIVNRFLGPLADVQVGLVALAGFLQAMEIAGGYAVLAFTATTVAGCGIFAREHEDEPCRHGEHDIKQPLCCSSPPSMVLLTVYSLAFAVLMATYSSGSRMKTGVVVAAAFVISSLCQMALQRRAPRTESMLRCVAIFRRVHNVSVALVVGSSVIVSAGKLTNATAHMKEFLASLA